jgi:hypothetical protein
VGEADGGSFVKCSDSSGYHASEAKIATLVDSHQCGFVDDLFSLVVAPLGRNLL